MPNLRMAKVLKTAEITINFFGKSCFLTVREGGGPDPELRRDHLLNWNVLDFAFQPGEDIEVHEGSAFHGIAIHPLQFLKKCQKSLPQSRLFERKCAPQKRKNLIFNHTEVFHFGHEPVNGPHLAFQDDVIAQLVMGNQVQQPRITLEIGTQVGLPMNDFVEVYNRIVIIPATKV